MTTSADMKPQSGEAPDFIVLPARSRRSPALTTTCYGDQLEHVVIGDRWKDAVVIYAADLGRALAVASNLRSTSDQLILLDLHATVADSVTEWRTVCANIGDGQTRNRLSYSGTVTGLHSYLKDLALLRAVDGVLVSVSKYSATQGKFTCADATDLVLSEMSGHVASSSESSQLLSTRNHPAESFAG
ncbi:hypothetical protein [Mycolicibacterium goodii]|uniref:hypothetical protein n=1 Tax=Mycolicibacterium goodii TaxID=134601 RepID=UPI001BDC2819|nr:hypothetical protein [Mycolicibacterium goodii]MBU8820843.1 hypothetical protein [Mycolicibacterium goodii]MBU8834504.1 hypothetical protein [Mycolicibacterium goodii]